MTFRYLIARIGLNPDSVEIDEAVALITLYNEERALMLCPLMGGPDC